MKDTITILLIIFLHISGFAQVPSIIDSIAIRINQITALQQSGEHERAQLEVEGLRWYVKREKSYFPARSISTIMEVYKSNKDIDSQRKFLEDATACIGNVKESTARVALTTELIRIYEQQGQLDRALILQKQLTADSAVYKMSTLQTKFDSLRRTTDSLMTLRLLEFGEKNHTYQIERRRIYLFAAAFGVTLLALLLGQLFQRRRYERELLKKDEEIRHLKGYLANEQHMDTPPFEQPTAATPSMTPSPIPSETVETRALEKVQHSHIPSLPDGQVQIYKPKYQALLVEPNRQIAIYLKSLLGPEYEVTISSTMAEARELAQEEIPDLVITDTQLDNQRSGIDLTRQIKQDIRTNHIPVVLVSGADKGLAEQERQRAGADLVIPKPLLDDDFDAQLNALFKERSARNGSFDHMMQLWFTPNKQTPADHFLHTVLQYVERYLPDASFSPSDLARLMQLDKQVFNRKVIALTGREAHDIIRIMRLEKAKYLLENRVAVPQIIAGLVGFDNPGAFTRAFKEHFGDTSVLLLNS